MSDLLEGASGSPVDEGAEELPAATEKKRTRRRKEPGAEETTTPATTPAVKRTRRKKAVAEEPVALEAPAAEAVIGEQPVAAEAVAAAEEPVAAETTAEEIVVQTDEPAVGEAASNESNESNEDKTGVEQPVVLEAVSVSESATEDEVSIIESQPSESAAAEETPAPAASPAAPLLPIKFRPAETTGAGVDPSKRRRIEETERRQRRVESGARPEDGDRPFRIEPISVRGPRGERDAARKERAQAVRDPGAPNIPTDVKVFVPPSAVSPQASEPREDTQLPPPAVRASEDAPAATAARPPLSARLLRAQELFAARESEPAAVPATSLVSPKKPVIVTEAEPLTDSPQEAAIEPVVPTMASAAKTPAAGGLPSPIWHTGLAGSKPRVKPKAKPAATRRRPASAGTRASGKRSLTKPYAPRAKRIVKQAAGKTAGRGSGRKPGR